MGHAEFRLLTRKGTNQICLALMHPELGPVPLIVFGDWEDVRTIGSMMVEAAEESVLDTVKILGEAEEIVRPKN